MKNSIGTLLFVLLTIGNTFAQEKNVFTFEEEGQVYNMEERMAQQNAQGVSLCVIKNLEVDTLLQWGFRDAGNQLAVNENTLFQVGGMAAALTKFAIMRLVNEGKIDLDTNVNTYLKSWKFPESKITNKNALTVRDLLLHNRGFKTVSKPSGYVEGSRLPNLQQMLNGEAPSNQGPVQLKSDKNRSGNSSYHNSMVLHQLLEDMYQMPFAQIMQTQILDPLGMEKSIFTASLPEEWRENAALGYDEDGKMIEGGRQVYPELACAGLWTTAKDYALFVTHILKAAKGVDNRFLSVDLAQAAITPQHEYRGLILFKNDNLYWGGASEGFYTQFEANAEEGWVVVAFINTHLRWMLSSEIRFRAKQLVTVD